ncbi:MAG: MarR family transcriptional regulator, partial [Candidatus Hodarchaeota archaeon]
MPASENMIALKETEKTILGALLAFGIRSPESISSHTGLKTAQITRTVNGLVKQGLIVKKPNEKGDLLVPTPFGLHVAQSLLIELTEDLERLGKSTSNEFSELYKQIQTGFKDLSRHLSKVWDEFPDLVTSLVTEYKEKLSTSYEVLLPILEIQEDVVQVEKEMNYPKERIAEVVKGLQTQIDDMIQTLGEFVHQTVSEDQPLASSLRDYGPRITQLLEISNQTRNELQEQIRQLSKQAEDLAQIDSTLGIICTTFEEVILQDLDNCKDEFAKVVEEYVAITKQDTSIQNKLVETLQETTSTLSTTNTTATNSLDAFSSQIELVYNTLKEKHSTISTLIEQFLETQGDMKDSPSEYTNDQTDSEDRLTRTLVAVNSTIDEVLQPTISTVRKTFDELKNQTQEKISELENIHQQILD